MNPEDRAQLAGFFQRISERLEHAGSEYGGSAKTRPLVELCDELGEELEDISGWSFWLWCRVKALRERVSEVDTHT